MSKPEDGIVDILGNISLGWPDGDSGGEKFVEYSGALTIMRALSAAGFVIVEKQEAGFGCHCDLEPDQAPDDCVIDSNRRSDCAYAAKIENKWQCQYWKPRAMLSAIGDGK